MRVGMMNRTIKIKIISITRYVDKKNVRLFRNHNRSSKPPKRSQCEELKRKYADLLEKKNWLKINVFDQVELSEREILILIYCFKECISFNQFF